MKTLASLAMLAVCASLLLTDAVRQAPASAQTLMETAGAAALQPTLPTPNAARASSSARRVLEQSKKNAPMRETPFEGQAPLPNPDPLNRMGAPTAPDANPPVPTAAPSPAGPALQGEKGAPAWRLKGTATGDGEGVAVVQYANGEVVYLHVGDELAGFGKVMRVQSGSLTVQEANGEATYAPW